MTPDECDDFKKEILREIETHKINIYEFPDHDDEEENRFVPSLTNSLWSRGDSIIWDFMGRLISPNKQSSDFMVPDRQVGGLWNQKKNIESALL